MSLALDPTIAHAHVPQQRQHSVPKASRKERLQLFAFLAGIGGTVVALELPWFDRHTFVDIGPASLRFAVGAGWSGWGMTWGSVAWLLVAMCCLCRFSSLSPLKDTRAGRFAATQTRTVAWCIASLPVVVIVYERYVAYATIQSLLYDQARYIQFANELPYNVGGTPLVSVFGISMTPQWSLLLNAVGAGLPIFALAGMSVVLTTSRSVRTFDRSTAPGSKNSRTFIMSLVVIVAALSLFAMPLLARWEQYQGSQAATAGKYAPASRNFQRALVAQPGLASSNSWVNTEAQIEFAGNGPSSAGGELWAAQTYADAGYPVQQLAALETAYTLDPTSVVISEDLVLASVGQAVARTDPTPLLGLPAALQNDDLVRYTLGRIRYRLRDDVDARASLLTVAATARSGDMRSSAWTYLAFIDEDSRHLLAARGDIERALALDPDHANTQAAAYATGLYELAR
ncbi:MAG TPA: hypothetical protein VGD55_07605 [Acidothermaceae bacterium]